MPRPLPFAALALVCAGCASGTYPVEGVVVYADGSPAVELAGGTVVFESAEARVSAAGEIDAAGGFRLTTAKPGDGAPPGRYQVLIAPPEAAEGGGDDRPKVRAVAKRVVDARYQRFATSGLEAVVEAKTNRVTLTIDRPR
ncbi:MAG: hypothetical protein C0501_13525 [Isosphaera sp.]|nr:hypothetical protein [Isosphaera sp.]